VAAEPACEDDDRAERQDDDEQRAAKLGQFRFERGVARAPASMSVPI
jgi:hypothetical protein